MSNNETKVGFRVHIESLCDKDYNDAFTYFLPILGKPEDLDEYKGKVEYFRYTGKYQAVKEYTHNMKDKIRWFVDYLVSESDGSDGGEYVLLSISQIQNIVSELIAKFGVSEKDIKLFSYTWYNGCDEPVYWEKPE